MCPVQVRVFMVVLLLKILILLIVVVLYSIRQKLHEAVECSIHCEQTN